MRPMWIVLMLLTVLIGPARADVLTTRQGDRHEGQVRPVAGGFEVVAADGSVLFVRSSDVAGIEVAAPNTAAGADDARLASQLSLLLRQLESVDDPREAVRRLENFLQRAGDTPTARLARQQLDLWQTRADQGHKRLGRDWLEPQVWLDAQVQRARRAIELRQMIADGKTREAELRLRRILGEDPTDPAALYLMATLQFRAGQLSQARQNYELVLQQVNAHAPSRNQLAIIHVRQRQLPQAFGQMLAAIDEAPGSPDILDNALELLNLTPPDQRRGTPYTRLAERFEQADRVLAERRAREGLSRFGSAWIDQAERERIDRQRAQIQQRIAELQNDFNLTEQRIARIDLEIDHAERTLRTIEQQSLVRTPDGRLIRTAYPPAYFDIQRDITRLRAEQNEMVARIAALRDAAQQAKSELPEPTFTGRLKEIGEDGVPMAAEALDVLFPPAGGQPAESASPARPGAIPDKPPDDRPPAPPTALEPPPLLVAPRPPPSRPEPGELPATRPATQPDGRFFIPQP